MANIHLMLQGKGGIGKSFAAYLLAQFLDAKGKKPLCFDSDPINKTFSGYKGLDIKLFDIMEDDEIDVRRFDALVDEVANSSQDVIIDSGASSFVAMLSYLLNNGSAEIWADHGHQLILHVIITGGQSQLDTISGFTQMANQFSPDVQFVIWLNPYWGQIERDGVAFEQMKAHQEHKDKIRSQITIPTFKAETFGFDLACLLKDRQTFAEAQARADISIASRQRLKIMQEKLFGELENAKIL
jgi:hypothetical protein